MNQNCTVLKDAIKNVQLVEMKTINNEEQLKLKESLDKVNLESTTATVMSTQDNVEKLKNVVKSAVLIFFYNRNK